MIYSKRVNIVLTAVLTVFLIVCSCMIVRINMVYPKGKVVTNDADHSIMWLGCKVTAIEKKIYNIEDYISTYPNDASYKYLLNGDHDLTDCRIVVFKVNVKNMTDSKIKFNLFALAEAESYPSYWWNGIPQISGNSNLEPGADSDFEVNSFYGPTLVHGNLVKTMDSNEFHLVFSYYPDRIVLKFD